MKRKELQSRHVTKNTECLLIILCQSPNKTKLTITAVIALLMLLNMHYGNGGRGWGGESVSYRRKDKISLPLISCAICTNHDNHTKC